MSGDYGRIDPLDPELRSYGYIPSDRRHQATLSWTWHLGDPAEGGFKAVLLNGWNLSGVSTYSSGQPIRLGFGTATSTRRPGARLLGNAGLPRTSTPRAATKGPGDITPTYTCDPRVRARRQGRRQDPRRQLHRPSRASARRDRSSPPTTCGHPRRNFHDITVFKDFKLGGDRRLQFRVGAFNLFNQAYPVFGHGLNDFDLTLATQCNVRVTGVSNGAGGTTDVCDPTGGYRFTDNTLAELRQDHHQARPPRRRVRSPAVLLGTADGPKGEGSGPPLFLPSGLRRYDRLTVSRAAPAPDPMSAMSLRLRGPPLLRPARRRRRRRAR